MSPARFLLLGCSCLIVVGCSGDDDEAAASSSGVSCRVEAGDTLQCIEYRVPPEALGATRDGCSAGGGTVVTACPTENRLGTCTVQIATTLTIITRYYAGGLTLDSAQQLCSGSGGTWAPG